MTLMILPNKNLKRRQIINLIVIKLFLFFSISWSQMISDIAFRQSTTLFCTWKNKYICRFIVFTYISQLIDNIQDAYSPPHVHIQLMLALMFCWKLVNLIDWPFLVCKECIAKEMRIGPRILVNANIILFGGHGFEQL